jgi:hypothetical protein
MSNVRFIRMLASWYGSTRGPRHVFHYLRLQTPGHPVMTSTCPEGDGWRLIEVRAHERADVGAVCPR